MEKQKLSKSVIKKTIKSVKNTVILLCFIASLVVLGVVYSFTMKDNESRVKLYTAEIDKVMAEKVAFINTVATGVSSGVAKGDYNAYVDQMVEQCDDVSAVYVCVEEEGVVYSDGIMTYMSGGWVPDADFVVSERSWYKGAIESDGVYVSEPYVDVQTGNICITLSKKVYSNGKVIGTAGLDMYMDDLVKLIQNSYEGGNYVFLVSEEGTILTHPDKKIALTADSSSNVSKALSGKYNKVCKNALSNKIILDYSGGFKLAISSQSEVTGWKIVAVNSVTDIIVTVVLTIILTIVFGVIISIIAKKYLSKGISPLFLPLEDLSANVHRISDGELDYSFNVDDSSEEVNALAVALNNTIKELKQCIFEITNTVTSISEKNLDFSVDGEYSGDYEKIKVALAGIIDVLNACFSEVKEQAANVLQYSDNLSETSESVAQAASEQSEAVMVVSHEMEHLSANMEKISEFAALINKNTNKTNESLTVGKQEMNSLVEAMDEIANCYEEIAEFISEINGIASQTGLLALNASIEAARSGEAGKGFAVVAAEIGSLSNSSTDASTKISDAITRSLSSVEKGKELVAKADRTISDSVNYSRENTRMVGEIVGYVETQKRSADGIFENLSSITEIVETNAANAEENSAISMSMGECAQALMDTISEFKLK